jgi:hypothetical protein
MNKIVVCFLILCGVFVESYAMPVKAVTLPAGCVLEAKFIQQRHLKGIPKAIESKGNMVLWDGKGVAWSTTSPFPNTIVITKNGLYQWENKIKTSLVKASGNNAMFDVMAGIFNMKEDRDVKGFTIEDLPASDSNWRMRLTPQYSQVQNFIKSITLEGNAHVTQITISRPNGDRDEIEISGHILSEIPSQRIREYFNE